MYGRVGSVSFEVYVDGVKQFDSGLMQSKDPQQYIEVSLAGAKELKLVVTDGGNGIGSDHATWGDTKLYFVNSNREGIDRSKLNQLLITSQELRSNDYTEESWNQLMSVVDEVNSQLMNGYTQEKINSLTSQLEAALNQLILATNYQSLIELLEVATSIEFDKYTNESIEVLKHAMNQATEMIAANNSQQYEVDQMVEQLQVAINELEEAIDLNQVVEFTDETLKLAVIQALNLTKNEITMGDILNITHLDVSNSGISSLTGLEYAKNLQSLDISYNQITNLSPLSELNNLTHLNVGYQLIEGGMLETRRWNHKI